MMWLALREKVGIVGHLKSFAMLKFVSYITTATSRVAACRLYEPTKHGIGHTSRCSII